ncbi:hypothetical protein GCM10011332_32370 [Terasakiella brassicae]|uniref:Replication-relaxation n=2 Tax=Terasakiella brassicae TaxID=1634917 RepID=A0A917FH91_9PROT|nr:hypothetical protein GCM10011332_32370 [Terasakiella brassicae]
MSKTYLPRDKRQDVPFSLTERDIDILRAVNRYRYLQTSQIQRLVFPDNKTKQSTARRLKYLYHAKYLGRIQPYIVPGKGGAEVAYFLDRKGQELLTEMGEKVSIFKKSHQVKTMFLQHALDLSEFRLNVELALQNHSVVEMARFICDFEMKGHADKATRLKRYKLYHEVYHPLSKERYVVYPDGLMILQGKGEYAKKQRLYFVEIDRGTETLSTIRKKVIGYNLYQQEKVQDKFGKFKNFVVLIQTSSQKRAANIRKNLVDQPGSEFVYVTSVGEVFSHTIFNEPIWLNHQNQRDYLLS